MRTERDDRKRLHTRERRKPKRLCPLPRLFWTCGACFLATVFAAAPACAADPQGYTVATIDTGQSDLDQTLTATSELIALADKGGVAPFALIERAKSDIPRLQTALDSFGYYQNDVAVTIDGHALDDSGLPSELEVRAADNAALVQIVVKKGPLYRIGDIVIRGTLSDAERAALGLSSGDPAIASRILGANVTLLAQLRAEGYALAKVDGPTASANDQTQRIDLEFTSDRGAIVEIGTISFRGLVTIHDDVARRALRIKPGDRFDPVKIEASRQALMGLGVFASVTAQNGDHLAADGRLPVSFVIVERPLHAVNLSGTYSTDLGVSLSASWSDRNLFGGAEQLNLSAAGNGLGTASVGLGYDLTAQYVEPLFFADDQSLELSLSGVKQDLIAYDQQAETASASIRKFFSTTWNASAGLLITNDNVEQENSTRLYQLVGLPLTANYDNTGVSDLLRDPTTGIRASLTAMPTHAFGAGDLSFLILQASGSTYFDFGDDGRSVLALRSLAAAILGGSNTSLPPDRRLYLGGSGSVRGFAYQTIGPLFADRRPVGAKSVDAGTVEFRQRIGETWGAAAFVDAGQTSADSALFRGAVRVGAGAGVRYYTPIGAVRLDFAIPVTRIPGGDAFEFYIGLGQSF